jgi:hypothetical protein
METQDYTNYENRRISPNGLIDLPFTVRKALGFQKGQSKLLRVEVEGGLVRIDSAKESGPYTTEASPRGLLKLPKEAHQALSEGKKGRYRLAQESKEGKPGFYLRSSK